MSPIVSKLAYCCWFGLVKIQTSFINDIRLLCFQVSFTAVASGPQLWFVSCHWFAKTRWLSYRMFCILDIASFWWLITSLSPYSLPIELMRQDPLDSGSSFSGRECLKGVTYALCHIPAGCVTWYQAVITLSVPLLWCCLILPLKRSTFQLMSPLGVTKYCCSNPIVPSTFFSWELREYEKKTTPEKCCAEFHQDWGVFQHRQMMLSQRHGDRNHVQKTEFLHCLYCRGYDRIIMISIVYDSIW